MYQNKKILAIIPARGGSKGIPRKNIKPLAGKPLIAWSIEEAKKSKYIDRLIVSSEDEEIIEVAKKWGCEVPFKRPIELARDNTPGVEPVIHALDTIPEKYNYVCLLQPTSPLRTVEHIDGCIEKCLKNNADSCVSVAEVNKHPYWMFMTNDNDELKAFFENININVPRQELPKAFTLNGAVYVCNTEHFIKNRSFISSGTIAYTMNAMSSLDIDSELDFLFAEFLMDKFIK